MINAAFWQDKKVMVTGHTGFKGSWLSLWLVSLQAEVYGYALEPLEKPNMFQECMIGEKVHSVFGDVRDGQSLQAYMHKVQPEIIFHLAAQPLVRKSYGQPVQTFETNLMGTIHLLEAARHCPSVKAIVVITTDKCYENREWLWGYRESDRLGGYDPYAASKACVELATASYRQSFLQEQGIHIATARAGNVIGGGDWAEDRLIPDCVKAIQKQQPVVLRNPGAIRPWQFVLEPLAGYMMLAERLYQEDTPWAEAWNFGPDRDSQQTVEMVVAKLCELLGGEYAAKTVSGLHESQLLRLDISKVVQRLHWKPKLSLERALEMTADWYKVWLSGRQDMLAFTLQQIKEYQGAE